MTSITAFTFLVFFANVLLVPATVLSFIQDATQNVLSNAKVDVDIKVPVTEPPYLCHSSFFRDQDVPMRYFVKTPWMPINSSEPDFGATCMHGPEECAGNVQQLCAAKYSPFANWWEFVHCNNYEGRNKIGLPETARKCAQTAQIDWETSGVGECAGLDASGKGAEGVRLFHKSVALGKAMGLEKSCTIYINGEKVCVHDETWKECENGHTVSDFTRQINEAYDKLNA